MTVCVALIGCSEELFQGFYKSLHNIKWHFMYNAEYFIIL